MCQHYWVSRTVNSCTQLRSQHVPSEQGRRRCAHSAYGAGTAALLCQQLANEAKPLSHSQTREQVNHYHQISRVSCYCQMPTSDSRRGTREGSIYQPGMLAHGPSHPRFPLPHSRLKRGSNAFFFLFLFSSLPIATSYYPTTAISTRKALNLLL